MFTRILLLAAVALASISAVAAEQACTPGYNQVVLAGSYLDFYSANLNDCEARCLSTSNCVGFTVFGSGSNQVCMPLSTITSETYNPNAVAISKRCMDASSTRLLLLPQEKADYPGMDIANALAANPTACSYKCQDTPGCNAYSWNNYNGGTCWMKSAKPDSITSTDGSVVSGEVYKCQRPQFSADATGTDLSNVLRAKYTDCCGVCRRTQGCVGSSWSNYNGGTCWLKSSITGFTANAGVTSFVL